MDEHKTIVAAMRGAGKYIEMSRRAADKTDDAQKKASWERGIAHIQCLQAAASAKIPVPLTMGKCCPTCGREVWTSYNLPYPKPKNCPNCGQALDIHMQFELGDLIYYKPHKKKYNQLDEGIYRFAGVRSELLLVNGERKLFITILMNEKNNDKALYSADVEDIYPLSKEQLQQSEISDSGKADYIKAIQERTLASLAKIERR